MVVGDYEGASPALRGFYLQDADGDGDPATSEAIFVFNGDATDSVASATSSRSRGPATEFQGQTQISHAGDVDRVRLTAPPWPPTDVALPIADATDARALRGHARAAAQTLYVTEHFQLGRFGQVVVSSGGPARSSRRTSSPPVPTPPRCRPPTTSTSSSSTTRRTRQNPDPIVFGRGGQPLSATNTLRGGDTVTGVTA